MTEPPEIKHPDFSEFHDLMHAPFTRCCWSKPGRWWRHVALWWKYMGWPAVAWQTCCRVGWHKRATASSRHGGTWVVCWWCDKQLEAKR